MKVAALILGILGGVFALGTTVFRMFLGGFIGSLGGEGAETVMGLGIVTGVVALIGLVAGCMATKKTMFAGWTMAIAAVALFFLASFIPAVMFLIAAVLAIVAAFQAKSAAAAAPTETA